MPLSKKPTTSQPLVSVCIPSYNSAAYVQETIDCLLQQTYTHLEIIAVDDGSTDNTRDIFGAIQDKRFTYFMQENKGAAAARNAAFALCSGEYIKFMDADDLLNLACIEKQLEVIRGKTDCIASAPWGRFYAPDRSDFALSREKVWKDLPAMDWLIQSLHDTGANMMQPGIFLAPRSVIERAGPWNESLSLIDDFEYMIRVISHCKTVLFCGDALLLYRSGIPNNLSGQKTARHLQSAFDSLQLGIGRILNVQDDAISRRTCANIYKRWSYIFYPDEMELFHKIEDKIHQLGGADIPLIGSNLISFLSKTIGWKNAKKLKKLLRPHSSD